MSIIDLQRVHAFRGAHEDITSLTCSGDDTETQLSFAMPDQLVETSERGVDLFSAGAGLLTRLGELRRGPRGLICPAALDLRDRLDSIRLVSSACPTVEPIPIAF